MKHNPQMVERAALAIYRQFLCGGYPRRQLRDANGRPATDHDGLPIFETAEQVIARRWQNSPELTRSRFREEALAALEAA